MYQNLINRVEEYCIKNKLLEENMGIVTGLSGGADSVFLLKVFQELQRKWKLRLCAVHINHGIRGQEALRDEIFAEKYAKELGIPFQKFAGDIPSLAVQWHMSEEEAGRTFRYQCFEQVRVELGYDVTAVAHHREDQAETILFHMLRGSGLRGLGGMRAKRDTIIRPLLCVGKQEILQGLEEKNIGFCVDSTNEDTQYSRNKIRREVLPLLQQVQGGAVLHLVRMAEEMQEVSAYLSDRAEECFRRIVQEETGSLKVRERDFLLLPDVLQRELVIHMLEKMAGKRKDIGAVHVAQVRKIFAGKTGKKADLPYGIVCWKEYGYACMGIKVLQESGLALESAEKVVLGKKMTVALSNGQEWFVWAQIEPAERFAKINLKKYCTKCFDYDRMDTMPMFRYWETGDFLWLDREGHRKKLSRIFMDEKISLQRRRIIPVLAIGNHVLWIPELDRQSAYYYVTGDTKRVFCIDKAIVDKSGQK